MGYGPHWMLLSRTQPTIANQEESPSIQRLQLEDPQAAKRGCSKFSPMPPQLNRCKLVGDLLTKIAQC